MMVKLFMDTEFTGLHKDTTLISIGIVSDTGKEFYAELTDFDENQVDDWIKENVIDNLMYSDLEDFHEEVGSVTLVKGPKEEIEAVLTEWLAQFRSIELWSDCHHYDIVLFHDIFGGAFSVPSNVYYIPYDISTVFKIFGIDPDISREAFIDAPVRGDKHNSLYDAKVIQACYDKLYRNRDKYPFMI
jgi:hypothetical protein